MSSKQKIAVSAVGIVLVLAIIGLTVGLVLVASQATVTNTMKVTYEVTSVDCTVTASVLKNNEASDITISGGTSNEGKTLTFNAEDATSAGAFAFGDAVIENNGNDTYTYVFTIVNTGTMPIMGVGSVENNTEENLKWEVKNSGEIAEDGTGTVTFTVSVVDKSQPAEIENAGCKLTISKYVAQS